MFKKVFAIILVFFLFVPALVLGKDASDIVVPPGFRVEKVLEVNKCPDPQNIAFLQSGDFLVASMMWRILQVSPSGTISTRAKFLTNKEPNPFDIMVTPFEEIYFSHWDPLTEPGLYRLENDQPVRVTPRGWVLYYFAQDNSGNFYAVARRPNPLNYLGIVKISDSTGDGMYEVVTPLIPFNASGIIYRDGYLYLLLPGAGGGIVKYDTAGNYVGPIIGGLNYPDDLAIDSQGNFYTVVYDGDITEGYATYSKNDVIKISPAGNTQTIVDNFKGGLYISISPDDVLYLSEFDRGVISKVINGDKIDVTEDAWPAVASDLAFDILNRPYISSFRLSQLWRLDLDTKTLEAVTPPLGTVTQTIAVDEAGQFYLSEGSNRLFRVDPISGTIIHIYEAPWSRMLRFDAFGRFVLVQKSVTPGPTPDDINATLGIFDFTSGTVTPYISGPDLRIFLFDENQNLFARYRRWEGIIKVNVPEIPSDPPFNTEGVQLFYDLKSKNSEIRYFNMNANGQLLIPLVDTGEVVLGETNGSWNDFAAGFDWPGYVRFDRNGVLYVVDNVDGVYRIIGRSFVVPAVSQRLLSLETDIRAKIGNSGIVTSLNKMADSAISSLEKGNITAAMKQIESLILAVKAQKGKKITNSDAEQFIAIAGSIIAGLKLL